MVRQQLLPTLDAPPSATVLPRVEWLVRSGTVLHPSPLGAADVLGLNLTRGCLHRCAFCSVRAAPGYPGDEVVFAYRNTAERLAKELAERRERPRAVYISPATDPFPPHAEIQAETARVVDVLAAHGVQAWLLTRGHIRPAALRVLAARREFVKVTVGITTLDRSLQRVLEPLTASPRLRLRQLAQLRRLGVGATAALEPLVPGLTDTRENLIPLLDGLARVGVKQATAGYLFLRPAIAEQLARQLEPTGAYELVADAFQGGPVLTGDGVAAARYLPRERRQRGYAALMSLAAERGIRVSVSRLANPDFPAPRPVVPEAPRQRLLPLYVQAFGSRARA